MDIFSILLSGQGMAFLAGAVSLGIVFRGLTGMAGQMPDLRIRLDQIESQLEAQLVGIPAAKETIKEMSEGLGERKQLVQKLQDYHNVLLEIERKIDDDEQEKKDAGEIQIHRPGGGIS